MDRQNLAEKTLKKLPLIDRQSLNYFKDYLAQQLGDNLVLLKLYGSKARGDWNQGSDIDILVVAKGAKRRIRDLSYKAAYQADVKSNFKASISPAPYTLDDYQKKNNPPTSFFYSVNLDGKKLK